LHQGVPYFSGMVKRPLSLHQNWRFLVSSHLCFRQRTRRHRRQGWGGAAVHRKETSAEETRRMHVLNFFACSVYSAAEL